MDAKTSRASLRLFVVGRQRCERVLTLAGVAIGPEGETLLLFPIIAIGEEMELVPETDKLVTTDVDDVITEPLVVLESEVLGSTAIGTEL